MDEETDIGRITKMNCLLGAIASARASLGNRETQLAAKCHFALLKLLFTPIITVSENPK